MQNKKNKFLFTLGSVILVMGVFGAGYVSGQKNILPIDKISGLNNKNEQVVTNADFGPFWKVWNTLNDKSIAVDGVDDQDKVWSAIEGLTMALNDPYTVFFPPEDNKLFQAEIHGSFSGIGAEVGKKDGILTVVAPLKNTPAERAGLKTADKILMIDNEDTSDMTIDKAISIIRGQKGTSVLLTILREGENKTRDVAITRDDINIPTIDTEIVDDTFVISFYTFSENSSYLFKQALEEFNNSNLNKLVVDLRGNPGGYLDSAVEITSLFLDPGKVIAIQDFGGNKKEQKFRSKGVRMFAPNKKLAILVDGGSASASEIMAGALSEYGVAKLVGTQTFGKGSVQELVQITDDTSLKVTVARWLTPNGRSISDEGLAPDYEVKITREDIIAGTDPQLNKAIELLK